MKTFIILFLISFNSYACLSKAPKSIVEKMIAGETVAGKDCKEAPEEECVCFDGVDVSASKFTDEFMNGNPIYSAKQNVTACVMELKEVEEGQESEEVLCEDLRASLCEAPYEFYYAENLILSGYEAYCTKLLGFEQVKTGKKILVVDGAKKAAHEKKKQDDKLKREEAKAKKQTAKGEIKKVDFEKINTVKALKDVVQQLIEAMDED